MDVTVRLARNLHNRWRVPPLLLAPLLLLCAFPTSAAPDTSLTATSVSHGVRITLTVPRHRYVYDGLERFTVTITNVSHARRYLQDFQPDWGGPYSPHILMRTHAGRLVYEEELSSFLAPNPGTLGANYILQPGASRTWHIQFVLQGEDIRAVSRVADGYTAFTGPPGSLPRSAWAHHLWHISSPWIHLALRAEKAPSVTITRTGTRLHVAVHAPWKASGPMFYMDSSRCWTGHGTMSSPQHVPWTPAAGPGFTTSLTAHCPSRQPWHAVVGWSNHRVLLISYADAARIR